MRILGASLLTLAAACATAPSPSRFRDLDAEDAQTISRFAEEARVALSVPGAAVVVVQGDRTILRQGFGHTRRRGGEKIGEDTPFRIASVTKPFTSLLVAKLVEEGRLSWQTPIRERLPRFSLADEASTDRIDFFHALCACADVPERETPFLKARGDDPLAPLLARLSGLRTGPGYGTKFTYSNELAAAGGYAAALGEPGAPSDPNEAFARALRARVLGPLGMNDTGLEPPHGRAYAEPHQAGADGWIRTVPGLDDAVRFEAPAGGLWSTARDLEKFLRFGLQDGRPLLAPESFARLREPIVSSEPGVAYALGFYVLGEDGTEILGHSGNLLGYTTSVVWIPEARLGIAILANLGGEDRYRRLVRRRVLELALDVSREAEREIASRVPTAAPQTLSPPKH